MADPTLPRAADLTPEVKRQMFEMLREKIGDDDFNTARKQFGEDGLVRLFAAVCLARSEAEAAEGAALAQERRKEGMSRFVDHLGSAQSILIAVVIAWILIIWLFGGVTEWWIWMRGHFVSTPR